MGEAVQELTEQELVAWRVVLRMRRALDRELDAHLASRGSLREADYEVLRPLYEVPGHEMRTGVLASHMEWEPSRLSHRLKQMERRGLVRRRASVKDRRGSVVGLTERGSEAYEQVRAGHNAWVKESFIGVLSVEEIDTLRSSAERILDRLAAAQRERVGTEANDGEL